MWLRLFAGDRVIFEVAEMSSHQRIIITVRADIERIKITEIHKFLDCSLKGLGWVTVVESILVLSFVERVSFHFAPVRTVKITEKDIE